MGGRGPQRDSHPGHVPAAKVDLDPLHYPPVVDLGEVTSLAQDRSTVQAGLNETRVDIEPVLGTAVFKESSRL